MEENWYYGKWSEQEDTRRQTMQVYYYTVVYILDSSLPVQHTLVEVFAMKGDEEEKLLSYLWPSLWPPKLFLFVSQ